MVHAARRVRTTALAVGFHEAGTAVVVLHDITHPLVGSISAVNGWRRAHARHCAGTRLHPRVSEGLVLPRIQLNYYTVILLLCQLDTAFNEVVFKCRNTALVGRVMRGLWKVERGNVLPNGDY